LFDRLQSTVKKCNFLKKFSSVNDLRGFLNASIDGLSLFILQSGKQEHHAMSGRITLFLWLILLPCSGIGQVVELNPKTSIHVLKQHLRNNLEQNKYPFLYPRSLNPDGTLRLVESRDWTSGFFSGALWMMYGYTRDASWLDAARKWSIGLEKEKANTGTHDVGLILYTSFGNGYRWTNDEKYKAILLEGAQSLSNRFRPKIGCIRSWDHGKWQFPVIIDNLMNLELLFWATRASGDSSFYKIAITHINTTLQNHFRPDNSSYHVVDYDTLTGKPIAKVTHQGYSNESAWARGQAWGLYGFTLAYRETKDRRYLRQAEKIADFYLEHPNLPKDRIPYWDFNAPGIPDEPRDAAAAAIAASGLLELSQYSTKGETYRAEAVAMLETLSSPEYLAQPGTNNNFFLKHCVGHLPGKSEIDVPLIYGDYYFLEALIRLERLK
jgi:unsaturated chondroitin disaccharide hydrolase